MLLLRGVALTTIYDTLAAVARMGAGLIGVISTAADGVLRTAFRIVGEVLTLAVQGLRFVAGALERTLNRLLPWVLDTVYGALTLVGESRLFRLLVHLTQVLPAILPGLHRVLNGTSAAPLPNEADLVTLGRTTISAPSAAALTLPSARFTPIMNLSELIVPDAAVTQLRDVVTQAGANITTNAGLLLRQAQDAVSRAGQEFTRAAGPGEAEFQRQFARHQREIQERADTLAGTLSSARRQAEQRPETALHGIASAYEGWLTGGGMRILLGGFTALLREDQSAAAAARAQRQPLPRGAMDAARATIEIQEGALSDEEYYTPNTIGLYVSRDRYGSPLTPEEAQRLRELLERLLPMNLRAVLILLAGSDTEVLYPSGADLGERYEDRYPFSDAYAGVREERITAALPGWEALRANTAGHVSADPEDLTTLRRRSFYPPPR